MKKVICSLFALSALSTAVAQEVNIKILGTSDVHGRIVPQSYGADVADKSGSYAQIATYVNDVRKQHKNVVLVDVGDAIQDNQIDVFAKTKKYYKDHPVPKVLNAMKYDVFVLGNHEFNFGMKALDEILKDIKAKLMDFHINVGKSLDQNKILSICVKSVPMKLNFIIYLGNAYFLRF